MYDLLRFGRVVISGLRLSGRGGRLVAVFAFTVTLGYFIFGLLR